MHANLSRKTFAKKYFYLLLRRNLSESIKTRGVVYQLQRHTADSRGFAEPDSLDILSIFVDNNDEFIEVRQSAQLFKDFP